MRWILQSLVFQELSIAWVQWLLLKSITSVNSVLQIRYLLSPRCLHRLTNPDDLTILIPAVAWYLQYTLFNATTYVCLRNPDFRNYLSRNIPKVNIIMQYCCTSQRNLYESFISLEHQTNNT